MFLGAFLPVGVTAGVSVGRSLWSEFGNDNNDLVIEWLNTYSRMQSTTEHDLATD